MVEMCEDEYKELVQGLEQNFGYGEEILEWLEDKSVLSIIVHAGKSPKKWLPNYLK
jgi:hypothetical protein